MSDVCPECRGRKEITGRGCPGFKLIAMPCSLCKGVGRVSEEQQEWIKRGQELRMARFESDTTLREEAKRLNVTASHLSDLERGCIENRHHPVKRKES